jgi:hypothetical protein
LGIVLAAQALTLRLEMLSAQQPDLAFSIAEAGLVFVDLTKPDLPAARSCKKGSGCRGARPSDERQSPPPRHYRVFAMVLSGGADQRLSPSLNYGIGRLLTTPVEAGKN